jgi:hypothetical protein
MTTHIGGVMVRVSSVKHVTSWLQKSMTLVFAASQLNRQQYGVRIKLVLNT